MINQNFIKITFQCLIILFATKSFSQISYHREAYLMGSYFDFTLIVNDSIEGKYYTDQLIKEVSRIENLISEWKSETIISKVNQNAGISPIEVPEEVYNLTKRAIEYSKITDGAFDISIVALDKIWKFDGSMHQLPSQDDILNSIANVGYQNIILNESNQSIFLKKKGMKIGFGSIGKSYAAEKCKLLMIEFGVKSGLINAAGDIACWGKNINHKTWNIGVVNPEKPTRFLKKLKLKNQAVTTSGSYTKFVEFDDTRYSHIINPKTGIPSTELKTVTVYGPNAEICNFLSTSIMVLGKKNGKKLLKKYPAYKSILL